MKTLFYLTLTAIVLCFQSCNGSKEIQSEVAVYAPISDFIFQGSVKVLHTSTIDAIDPEALGVVRVTNIIKKSNAFGDITGKDITIKFSDLRNLNEGDNYIFFSNPYFIGEEIAVVETGRMKPDESKYSISELKSEIAETTKKFNDDKLKERIQKSELIVFGTIVSVNVVKSENKLDSEHDPMWAEAEVQIDETLKGNSDKTVLLIFPSSEDIAWVNTPKFKKGDKGVYLLRKTQIIKRWFGRFVLTDKEDFITDKEGIDKIKSLSK